MILKTTILDREVANKIKSGQGEFEFSSGVNILVGNNGSGKSTLMRTIIDEFNRIKDKTSDRKKLDLIANLDREVMLYSPEQILKSMVDNTADSTTINTISQSQGELLRLYLKSILPVDGNAIVFMDEPETGLSQQAIVTLCEEIRQKKNTQFIIASHNIFFWLHLGANIISLDQDKDYVKNSLLVLDSMVSSKLKEISKDKPS